MSGRDNFQGRWHVVRATEQAEKSPHFEDLSHVRGQGRQHERALGFTRVFASDQHDAQAGRADIDQLGEIQDQVSPALVEKAVQLGLGGGCTQTIESADGTDDAAIRKIFMFYLHGNGLYLNKSHWVKAGLRLAMRIVFRLVLQLVFVLRCHASLLQHSRREAVLMVPAE